MKDSEKEYFGIKLDNLYCQVDVLKDQIEAIRDELLGKCGLGKCYKCRWWNFAYGCQSKYKCEFETYRKESE